MYVKESIIVLSRYPMTLYTLVAIIIRFLKEIQFILSNLLFLANIYGSCDIPGILYHILYNIFVCEYYVKIVDGKLHFYSLFSLYCIFPFLFFSILFLEQLGLGFISHKLIV